MSEMRDYFERLEDDKRFLRARLEESELYPNMRDIRLGVWDGEPFAIFSTYVLYDRPRLVYYVVRWNHDACQLETQRMEE